MRACFLTDPLTLEHLKRKRKNKSIIPAWNTVVRTGMVMALQVELLRKTARVYY